MFDSCNVSTSSSPPTQMTDLPTSDWSLHPEFAVPSSDEAIVLVSIDGSAFFVNTRDLARTSSVFADMFALPRPQNDADAIPVTEDGVTLEVLLKLGLGIRAPTDTLDNRGLERVLVAAQKYMMDGPAQVARALLEVRVLKMSDDPLGQYVFAAKHGYDVRESAFAQCMKVEIDMAKTASALQPEDWAHVPNVLDERKKRAQILLAAVRSTDAATGGPNRAKWGQIDNTATPFRRANRAECLCCGKLLIRGGVDREEYANAWRQWQTEAMACLAMQPDVDALFAEPRVDAAVRELERVKCPGNGGGYPFLEMKDMLRRALEAGLRSTTPTSA